MNQSIKIERQKYMNAKQVLETLAKIPNTRVSRTINSTYSFGNGDVNDLAKVPPQARKCFEIFAKTIRDKSEVSEIELRKSIEEHKAEFKTKQESWRIFQYYRPVLMQHKLLVRK